MMLGQAHFTPENVLYLRPLPVQINLIGEKFHSLYSLKITLFIYYGFY